MRTPNGGMAAGAALLGCLAGCAPRLGPAFEPERNPPADMAVVYVYRPAMDLDSTQVYDVSAGGRIVSEIAGGGYFVHFAPPGPTEFSARGSLTMISRAPVDLKAGCIYYLRVRPARSAMTVQPTIVQVHPGQARDEIVHCRRMP